MAISVKDITELDAATALSDSDLLAVSQGGVTKSVSGELLKTYADGKTAYEAAVDGGYTGTEAEFNALMATFPAQTAAAQTAATNAANSATTAQTAAAASAASAALAASVVTFTDERSDTQYTMAWGINAAGYPFLRLIPAE